MSRSRFLFVAWFLALTLIGQAFMSATPAAAQPLANPKHTDSKDVFFPITNWLPTPGVYRTASGAPGPLYWQQRADYDINVRLDDESRSVHGDCRITYHNQSPHKLSYVWIQLDQNRFRNDSTSVMSRKAPSLSGRIAFRSFHSLLAQSKFEGGYEIKSVTQPDSALDRDSSSDATNDGSQEEAELPHLIVDTMMRVDLPSPLLPGESTDIRINYQYNIVDASVIRARGGYEVFSEEGGSARGEAIYEISQWFPRMAAYTDYSGWQNAQFIGSGEFTLELGDYQVGITAPEDMVVTATGTLSNPQEALKPEWIDRLAGIKGKTTPSFIVTPAEAKANEDAAKAARKQKQKGQAVKTWRFEAQNVRDFAWAASRKFIWDAMPVEIGERTVTAMSFYPNEAEPLWSQYSTESIAHTIEVYSRYTFDYPYDVAISVNGPVYGMEYPMICFNGPRPEEDGTYSKATKYGLISVIIHEVGHNYFPMIVNSDERQWTWMDEGLNTFLQFLTEQEWELDYPSRRGPAEKIVPFMRGGNQRPIMTSSEEILQFGNNAYAKPAAALNILRETILGRERFDFAFREYCRRWKFKRPTPADFFRTMEDAAGMDLDWFWRGWFFSTDHVDIAIDSVALYVIDPGDPEEASERERREKDTKEKTPTETRNRNLPRRIEWQPGLKDYYNSPDYDENRVEESARKAYQKFLDDLDKEERRMLRRTTQFYVVTLSNRGGLVMPVPMRIHYADNTNELITFPAEIWRYDSSEVKKLLMSEKKIVRLEIDPRREIADTETSNNHWPPRLEPTRFKLYKDAKKKNPMQKADLGKSPAKSNGKDARSDGEKAADPSKTKDDPESENEKESGE